MSIKKNIITDKAIQDLEISIREYEDEYLKPFAAEHPTDSGPSGNVNKRESRKTDSAPDIAEKEEVSRFLSTPCPCGRNCQQYFGIREVLEAREDFRLMHGVSNTVSSSANCRHSCGHPSIPCPHVEAA